jgi:hypothetical protein
MPPKARQTSRNSIEKEGRILLALSALKNKEIATGDAAKHFNVPRSTLQDRLRGRIYRNEVRANGHKLTANEEKSLLQWILSRDRRGAAPRPLHVQQMANLLLAERGSTPVQTVGEKWVLLCVTSFVYLEHSMELRMIICTYIIVCCTIAGGWLGMVM